MGDWPHLAAWHMLGKMKENLPFFPIFSIASCDGSKPFLPLELLLHYVPHPCLAAVKSWMFHRPTSHPDTWETRRGECLKPSINWIAFPCTDLDIFAYRMHWVWALFSARGVYLNKAQSSRSTRSTWSPMCTLLCLFNPFPTGHKMYCDVVGDFKSGASITRVCSVLFCSSFSYHKGKRLSRTAFCTVCMSSCSSSVEKPWRPPQLAFTRCAYFMLTVFYRRLPFCNTKLHSSCGYSCSQIWNGHPKPNFCWWHCSKCEYSCNTFPLYHV